MWELDGLRACCQRNTRVHILQTVSIRDKIICAFIKTNISSTPENGFVPLNVCLNVFLRVFSEVNCWAVFGKTKDAHYVCPKMRENCLVRYWF